MLIPVLLLISVLVLVLVLEESNPRDCILAEGEAAGKIEGEGESTGEGSKVK